MFTKNIEKRRGRRIKMHKHKLEKKRDKKERSPCISTFFWGGVAVICFMLLFAGIEVASADTHDSLFEEGVKYPSPHLAPINPSYIIFFYSDGYYSTAIFQPHETVVDAHNFPETRYWAWADLGVLPLERTLCPEYGTEETMYQEYKAAADKGFYGMAIDEFSPWEHTSVENAISAIRHVKNDYPDFYVQAWYYDTTYWGGMSDTIASGQDVINLYIAEPYTGIPAIQLRIDEVKSYGLEGKSIMGLSSSGYFTPSEIDEQIKYIRTQSPQIASNGIAFFVLENSPTRPEFDAVVYENWFEPSPTAEIASPHDGDIVGGAVNISVSATPNPGTGSSIVSYRYFVDSECVRISSSPTYSWNTAGYSEGSHIITVHAVAEDYLVGVSQIEVIVGEAVTGTISGTVTDKDTGNPIEGAAVSANSYSNTTNATEGYTITLPVGTYTVTASKMGYQSQSQENVEVLENLVTEVNFALTEGTDLVGKWHFDEGSGTTAYDSSEYSNNGTLVNGPTWLDGIVGKALSFDGIDDYINCGNNPSLNITGPITIVLWLKPIVAGEGGPNAGSVCKAEEGVDWSWQLRYNAPGGGNYMGFQFNGDPEGSTWVSVKQNLSPGEWYHIAGTFDGTNIKCYLNGSETDTNQISAIKGGSSTLFIGQDGWDTIFNGVIDEVKIYNRALSAEEIKADYDAELEDMTPPASISDLQNSTGTTWINWTWTNPTDNDFNHTMVYLDGVLQTNTSDAYYNATGLIANISYEIGTHTVDINGNVNTTWVNQTTKTVNNVIPRYDVNEDGTVDILDTTIVGQHFGEITS